jgi:hypothetical protein
MRGVHISRFRHFWHCVFAEALLGPRSVGAFLYRFIGDCSVADGVEFVERCPSGFVEGYEQDNTRVYRQFQASSDSAQVVRSAAVL